MIDGRHAPGCTDGARLIAFSGSAPTMRALGFQVADDGITARLCLRHYLLAMNEILSRAGLPRLAQASAPPSNISAPPKPLAVR